MKNIHVFGKWQRPSVDLSIVYGHVPYTKDIQYRFLPDKTIFSPFAAFPEVTIFDGLLLKKN